MTILILMVWNVKIAWKKRLALMGIFSLTFVVTIFSVVIVSVVTTKKSQADLPGSTCGVLSKWPSVSWSIPSSREHERSDADSDRRNA